VAAEALYLVVVGTLSDPRLLEVATNVMIAIIAQQQQSATCSFWILLSRRPGLLPKLFRKIEKYSNK
jgi:hypothetical protein